MEGLTIKGNVPVAMGPSLSSLVAAGRVNKSIPSSTNKAPRLEKTPAATESIREVSARNQEAIQVMAEGLQSFLESSSYSLQFVPDSERARVIIRVLDSSGKVIRQIPQEDMARITDGLESFTGLLVDAKLE